MIYLVRHGQTDWNVKKRTQGHTDISLNDIGRRQAEDLQKKLENLDVSKIISSDLLRAKETAQIINDKMNVSIVFDSSLREINYGDSEGVVRETLNPEIWDTFNNNPEKLNAEPISSVYARIKALFETLDDSNENILIVTHGGALRVIMHYAEQRYCFDKEKYTTSYQNFKIKMNNLVT